MSANGQLRLGKDPWRKAPASELADQVLPRWFVLTAIVMIPIALAAVVGAFVVFGPDPVPPAARRPPPAGGLTTGVGDSRVGSSEPVPAGGMCPTLEGVRVAGAVADRAALTAGLDALCSVRLDVDVATRLREFARADGVIRFAQFQATGVDSTADLGRGAPPDPPDRRGAPPDPPDRRGTPPDPPDRRGTPPRVYVNAKFARTDPTWIAPLVAHDVTFLELDPATADGTLAARKVEAQVCAQLFADRRPSRGCGDAKALLSLPDPIAALRAAGFR